MTFVAVPNYLTAWCGIPCSADRTVLAQPVELPTTVSTDADMPAVQQDYLHNSMHKIGIICALAEDFALAEDYPLAENFALAEDYPLAEDYASSEDYTLAGLPVCISRGLRISRELSLSWGLRVGRGLHISRGLHLSWWIRISRGLCNPAMHYLSLKDYALAEDCAML